MRSPAAAVAWEFGRRHQWGFAGVGAYVIALAATRLLGLERSFRIDDAARFGLFVVVPMASTFSYFLAVFSFGISGDVAARQSLYPARMFSLPVSTSALAAWPMVYGMSAMVILWSATRLLALWPRGADVPVIWPALLASILLAWTQALTWMPYAWRGLRVIVMVLWLASIDAVVLVALQFKAGEAAMMVLLVPHVPLAFLASRYAVARARRGDIPEWSLRGRRESVRRHVGDFTTAARAQFWFEWRRYGRSLPSLVALVLPFELALLFVFRETQSIVFAVLAGALLTPSFMAAFVAATVRATASQSFVATRPLTDASLVAARLEASLASAIVAWLPVLVAVPLALKLSGTAAIVNESAQRLVEMAGRPRAIVIVLLGFAALITSTWKQLVQSLYIGMSGRAWASRTSIFTALALLAVGLPAMNAIASSREAIAVLWNAFPMLLGFLAALKIVAAAWIAKRLIDAGVLSDRVLVAAAICWSVAVFALYGVLAWIIPPVLIRDYVLVLLAVLEVPLARLSAAPLALASNRHR